MFRTADRLWTRLPGVLYTARTGVGDSAGWRRQAYPSKGHQDCLAPRTQSIGAIMSKTKTTRYDVAEHLRTPEEMAAYLEACFEEANGDAGFIATALGDIAVAEGTF